MNKMWKFALGVPMLVFSLAFIGCSGSEGTDVSQSSLVDEEKGDSASSGQLYAVGDVVELGDYTVSIQAMSEHSEDTTGYLAPDPGNKYVALEVLYENRTDGKSTSYNPFDWTVYDQDGYTFTPSFIDAKEPGLSSGDLNPGGKARGWITFEVAEDAVLDRAQFTPNIFSSKNVEFSLR